MYAITSILQCTVGKHLIIVCFSCLQMDMRNLCLMFGPTIISKPAGDADGNLVSDMNATYPVIELLMTHVSTVQVMVAHSSLPLFVCRPKSSFLMCCGIVKTQLLTVTVNMKSCQCLIEEVTSKLISHLPN